MTKYLLDTHTLIWAIVDKNKLSNLAVKILQDNDSKLFVSAVSFYENHKDPFDRMLVNQCISGNYTLISKDDKMRYYEDVGLKCIW